MRATKADLEQAVTTINKKLAHIGHPNKLHISYAYGQPRAFWLSRAAGVMIEGASPRDTKSAVLAWLDAFEAGLGAYGYAQQQKEQENPTLLQIAGRINALLDKHDGKIPQHNKERAEIEDELDSRAWYCARLLDRVKGTDPLKRTASSPALGTPNRRSITYKVRKALGYSYP